LETGETEFLLETFRRGDHEEDVGIDGRISK
jgi:hypothetical protein